MSSDSDNSSDEEFNEYLFKSSLDVGSHFVNIVPDNEVVFYNQNGVLASSITIQNVTTKANVAYLVFTSAQIPIEITPKYGFIPPNYQQVINIEWKLKPNADKLSHAMFFVKALPLSPEMNIDEMSNHMSLVFNPYNVNILFTVAALPSRVSASMPLISLQGPLITGPMQNVSTGISQPPGSQVINQRDQPQIQQVKRTQVSPGDVKASIEKSGSMSNKIMPSEQVVRRDLHNSSINDPGSFVSHENSVMESQASDGKMVDEEKGEW